MGFMDQVRPLERIEGNTLAKMAKGEINSPSTNTTQGTGALNADAPSEALSFSDLIDIINPLQHIPIVSSIYQALTGDEISAPAKFAGDALYMGPLGAAASIVNIALKEASGNDLGGHVVSLFMDEQDDPDITTVVAENHIQPPSPEAQALAAQIQTQSNIAFNNTVLAPDAVFSFPTQNAETPSVLNNEHSKAQNPLPDLLVSPPTSPVASFNASPEPIALESLPADILAALYSGTPLNADSTPFSAITGVSDSQAPRWNLWDTEEIAALPSPATLAPEALFPRALNAYENSASLKNQTQQPFVNLVQ